MHTNKNYLFGYLRNRDFKMDIKVLLFNYIYSVYRHPRFLNTGHKKARLLKKLESNIPLRKWEAIKRMLIKKKSICRV